MGAEGPSREGPIGVFGGTFDPFHHGHLVVAQDVLEALGLERILFVPAAVSPHKVEEAEGRTPAAVRYRMVADSVADDPRLRVSDLEVRRGGVSYTVDTLRALVGEGWEGIHLLMGADQWASFGRWREPEEIARLARLVVITREGAGAESEAPRAPGPGADSPAPLEVPVTRIDLSSSEIRRRRSLGRSLRYLVPEPARRIIESESLYR